MKKPTGAQVKEFWEWCGFYQDELSVDRCPDGSLRIGSLPTIDLNNLFKYAVPKLDGAWAMRLVHYVDSVNFHIELTYGTLKYGDIKTQSGDPALALFWALWQVKEKS